MLAVALQLKFSKIFGVGWVSDNCMNGVFILKPAVIEDIQK